MERKGVKSCKYGDFKGGGRVRMKVRKKRYASEKGNYVTFSLPVRFELASFFFFLIWHLMSVDFLLTHLFFQCSQGLLLHFCQTKLPCKKNLKPIYVIGNTKYSRRTFKIFSWYSLTLFVFWFHAFRRLKRGESKRF